MRFYWGMIKNIGLINSSDFGVNNFIKWFKEIFWNLLTLIGSKLISTLSNETFSNIEI